MDDPLLDELTDALQRIINGKDSHPLAIPEDYPCGKTKNFAKVFNQFLARYQELTEFVQEINKGKLNITPPRGRMRALSDMKGLHSNLRHLTWQTQRVAEGEYNQQVDFLGDFSRSFNMMTRQLKEAFEKIESQKMALEDANRFLEDLNKTDPLTGLGNRRAFDSAMNVECRQAERNRSPLSLALLDIDNFKKYNDGYGHQEGDECIRLVARTIRDHVNRPHDLAVRYGGEEFALILSGSTTQGAMAVAENIRFAVERMGIPHEFSGSSTVVTISGGVATMNHGVSEALDSLIERADKALYSAKGQGKNLVLAAAD